MDETKTNDVLSINDSAESVINLKEELYNIRIRVANLLEGNREM